MWLGRVVKDLEGQFVRVLGEALEAKRSWRRDGDDGIHNEARIANQQQKKGIVELLSEVGWVSEEYRIGKEEKKKKEREEEGEARERLGTCQWWRMLVRLQY